MTLPLSGLLVVSLEQAVAAPMCTCRLADAGARVIKIERPEGDFARSYDDFAHGESSYFVWLNRGKESVVLDLAKAGDKALLEAMLGRADIFVQNLKPGTVGKFSIARLRRDYPRLICCSISGFGESGPFAGRKAYDLLIQAEVGLASITGTTEPSRVGVSAVDVTTGLNAYEAIVEALLARQRSGGGAELSVSLFDAIADWMAVPLMQQEAASRRRSVGLTHASIAPYGAFPTRDGANILIGVQNDREWRVLAERSWAIPRSPPIPLSPPTAPASSAAPRPITRSRGVAHARRRGAHAEARRRRYRLRSRQRCGRACAPSASAPDHGRDAERAGFLSRARRAKRRSVAALRQGAGARRAHRKGARGIHGRAGHRGLDRERHDGNRLHWTRQYRRPHGAQARRGRASPHRL
jgi:formyl-CoA transferase